MFAVVICALVLVATVDVAPSEYQYLTTAQRWFKPHKIIGTWYEAKAQCKKEGAVLASPLNSFLMDYMHTRIAVNKHSTPYFIGIKAIYEPELQLVSIEGVQVDNLPEVVTDFIEQLDLREGDCLAMDGDGISAVSCWKRLPYICYKNDTIAPVERETMPVLSTTEEDKKMPVVSTTEKNKIEVTNVTTIPAVDPSKCTGFGYRYYPSVGCYKLQKNLSHWDEANKTCSGEGAYMLILDNEEEAQEVMHIFEYKIYSYLWMGIQNFGGDVSWRTVKGESMDDKYKVWEDDSYYLSTFPGCGGISKELEMVKYPCMYNLNVICEKDI